MYWIQELERLREEQRQKFERPVLQLPLPGLPPGHEIPEPQLPEEDTASRGVVILDIFSVEED